MAGIITGLTFAVAAVTGLIMFFNYKNGSITQLHQWIGLAFLAAAVWHVCINWRAFSSYLKSPAFWVGLAAVAIICALILALPGGRGQGQGRGRAFQTGYGRGINR